ncbi:MbtH family protein [Nocardia sp. NPDC060256]|uniref:MbtH family protein n=1 Tax=unclassified Nocardia TaxID=2637762 RepID=UPI003660253E
MTSEETDALSAQRYRVVVNHEEQYSIWPSDREIPLGWRAAGTTGSKEECLSYIDQVWTDITPLSVRTRLAETNTK